MKGLNKLVKKEIIKKAKNPGKINKQKRKLESINQRGSLIPPSKVFTDKKSKARTRQYLKKETKDLTQNF